MRVIPAILTSALTSTLVGCIGIHEVKPDEPSQAAVELPTHPAQRSHDSDDGAPAPTAADALEAGADAAPPPPADIWARMRDGFALPRPEQPRVDKTIAYFAGHPAYIRRVAQRAEPLLHYIVEAVDERDMPMEIALLPVVESAYKPFAYSHGRAAGLWQFIPTTGQHFGLKQNWWYDGRRDIIASTDAALTYLDRLHDMFDDWLLALAAYNAGEGTVMRAIKANERRGEPTDYWHLNLPKETQQYVPRLLAIRTMFDKPAQFGINLPEVPNKPHLDVVELESQIDLALAADLAGMEMESVYQLNPGYNRWATAPDGPHRLILPKPHAQQLRSKLDELPEKQRVQWQRHKVGPGETLSSIARQYRTTVAVLKEANDLNGHVIRAGEHLVIPVASRPSSHYALSEPQRQSALQSRERKGEKRSYRVRAGDTFWDIARRFGVSVAQLTQWNGLAPGDTLRPGQKLAVWTEKKDESSVRTASLRTGPAERKQSVQYTVRQGDSLYQIAQRFNVSVEALKRWNGLSGDRYLQPGQRLQMKVDVTEQAGI